MQLIDNLTNVRTNNLEIQTAVHIDDTGEFLITQHTCMDTYVMREDYITLTKDQVREMLLACIAYLSV